MLQGRSRFLSRTALLIIDEVGYLPLKRGGAQLFFQLINARYEKTLTSNRGFAEWGEILGDRVIATALLDRLLHHAVVIQIEGNSYRLREHASLMPENLKAAVSGKDKERRAHREDPQIRKLDPKTADHQSNQTRWVTFTSPLLGNQIGIDTRHAFAL